LDEADDNLASRHYKDSINRCREALEKTISAMLTAQHKAPSNKFSTDLGTLSNLGVIAKAPRRLIVATYSYLSEVGTHGRGGEATLGDSSYAMKEAYMRIDILLKAYSTYLSK
jgi:hypothetical protein